MIAFSVFLGLVAIIGVAFLAGGLEFNGPVIRTTATVIAVRQVTDFHLARTRHTEFTLRFTDQDHQVVTVQTDQVKETLPVAQGDRIQVYVPADPSEVTDVRFGPPGRYDYEMGAIFLGIAVAGWTVIVIIGVRKKRRIATMAATGLADTVAGAGTVMKLPDGSMHDGLLVAVEMWHAQHWAELAAEGISVTLRPRSTTYSKNSASIEFGTPSRAVSAVFWDYGESEVISAGRFDREAPAVSIHPVGSASEVEALLDRLHVELRGSGG